MKLFLHGCHSGLIGEHLLFGRIVLAFVRFEFLHSSAGLDDELGEIEAALGKAEPAAMFFWTESE